MYIPCVQEGKYPTHSVDRFSLDDALLDVLIHNKQEFVLLFLEIGANLKTFLDENRLLLLYEAVKMPRYHIWFQLQWLQQLMITNIAIYSLLKSNFVVVFK